MYICIIGAALMCITCGCAATNKGELVTTPIAWDSNNKPTAWLKQVVLNAKDPTGIDSKQVFTFIQDSEGLTPIGPMNYGDAGFAKHWVPAAIYGGTNALAAHELRPDTYRSNSTSTVHQSGASNAKSDSSAKTRSNAKSDSDSKSDSKSDSNSASDSNSNSDADSASNSNSNANAKTNQSQGQGQDQGQQQVQDQAQRQGQGQNQDQTSKNNLNQENTQKQQNSGKDDKPHR